MQPLAQIGIGGAHHARAGVGLHALDAGFGGQAGADRLAHALHPAAVMREHAIGFENVLVLAAVGDLAALQHHVDIRAHRGDRVVEPLEFARDVVGDEILDRHARLMQHDMAERDAFGERRAGEMAPRMHGGFGAGQGERGEFAGCDHFREHHRGGLQRLFFLFGIIAVRAVLHHQHAERIAGAQDRHAEEGMVDFLAGFRPVGEGRMRLRVRQVDGVGLARDQADQALVDPHHGLVDGFLVQALGGVKLERAVHAQHIDRAHLRDHVRGDQDDDLVEPVLRADRLRHDFAEPSQQHARAAHCASHGSISLATGRL